MHVEEGDRLVDTMDKANLTVIILTFNEHLHIERAIRSAQQVAQDILVVDSFSTDDTVELARKLGARVLQHAWVNHSVQLNWALAQGDIHSDWVMRLDADEYLDGELIDIFPGILGGAKQDVGGFEVNRSIMFLGKPIRHGGMWPQWVLRVWRNGWAKCESRWMDEHVILKQGSALHVAGMIIDDNRNNLTWWVQKHNQYASREALVLLDQHFGLGLNESGVQGLGRQASLKRYLKKGLYARLPLQLRVWIYFLYRVVVRLGFLDGTRGMLFHSLQGLWYRLLVDGKVMEVIMVAERDGYTMVEAIERVLGISMNVLPRLDKTDDE
jgi:glycosyltransferase involved in cell wall biosynthesis